MDYGHQFHCPIALGSIRNRITKPFCHAFTIYSQFVDTVKNNFLRKAESANPVVTGFMVQQITETQTICTPKLPWLWGYLAIYEQERTFCSYLCRGPGIAIHRRLHYQRYFIRPYLGEIQPYN